MSDRRLGGKGTCIAGSERGGDFQVPCSGIGRGKRGRERQKRGRRGAGTGRRGVGVGGELRVGQVLVGRWTDENDGQCKKQVDPRGEEVSAAWGCHGRPWGLR